MAVAERITKEQAEQIIRQTAREAGAEDLADVLVATAIAETGLDIYVPGDNGRSWGPYHENDAGRGSGLTKEQRQDVPAATLRAIREFREQQRLHPDASPGELAVLAQRPAQQHRAGYVAKVNGIVNDYQQNGDPNRNGSTGAAPAPRTVSVASNPQDRNYVFPIRGYKGGEIPTHWGSGDKGARGGADIFAPEGTPIQSMVSGTVQWANSNDSAGGNNVGILGDDGNTYYYAHMRDTPTVKPGQKVTTGQDLGVVGRTGNAANTPAHLHIGIGKGIVTGTGALGGLGRDFDATTLLNQALKGGTGYTPMSNTAGTARGRPPQSDIDARIKSMGDAAVANDPTLQRLLESIRYQAKDAQGNPLPDGSLAQAYLPLRQRVDDAQEVLKKYPNGAPPRQIDNPASGLEIDIPGFGITPGTPAKIPNPAYKEWSDADKTVNDLTSDKTPEGRLYLTHKKAYEEAQTLARTQEEKLRNEARDLVNRQVDTEAGRANRTQVVDGNLIDMDTAEVIGPVPRDAKPGQTFTVAGRGTFSLSADGKTAVMIPGTEPLKEPSWQDAGDRLVEIGPNGAPTGKTINKGTLSGPSVLGSSDGPTLTLWNPQTQKIEYLENKNYKPPKPDVISAPKEARYIVQQDKDGNLLVKENPNYDPNAGGQNLTTTSGKVAHVDASGKVTSISDTMTPEERQVYNRGQEADVGKAEADQVKTLIDASKALHDQEMERRTQEIWAEAQRIMADPNASRNDVIAAIQAGTKNAQEWSQVFQTHINQKTQEETARRNRVDESIRIQGEDRQLREGLYRDINETRNQRTNAQNAANNALNQSGTIGMARSMNNLAAQAPTVGMEGLDKLARQGYGVGAMALNPVKKTYQEHLDEIENLRQQMPSVRMASPNAGGPTPDFSIPRPTTGGTVGAIANQPRDNSVRQMLLDKAKGIMSGTRNPTTQSTGTVNTGVPMGGAGVSVATGQSVDEMAEEERKKREAAMNGAGGYLPRFQVPKARRAA